MQADKRSSELILSSIYREYNPDYEVSAVSAFGAMLVASISATISEACDVNLDCFDILRDDVFPVVSTFVPRLELRRDPSVDILFK